MPVAIFKYPLDLTGTASSNREVDEEYTIGAVRNRVFIPIGGPFFGDNSVLVDGETGRTLVPRVDFDYLHTYEEAEDRTDSPIYAAVWIKNPNVSTRILFTPQYIGGEFSYSYYALVQAIGEIAVDNRPIYWGSLIGTPSEFTPTDHMQPAVSLYGWKGVIDAQVLIAQAIQSGDTASRALLLETIQAKFDEISDAVSQVNTFSANQLVKMLDNSMSVVVGAKYHFRVGVTATLPPIASVPIGAEVVFSRDSVVTGTIRVPTGAAENLNVEGVVSKTYTYSGTLSTIRFIKVSASLWCATRG